MAITVNRAVFARLAQGSAGEEQTFEVVEPAVNRRKLARRAAALSMSVGAVAGCAVLWHSRSCVTMSRNALGSVTSFAEEYPSEMLNLVERPGDEDAVTKWLSSASEAARLVNENPHYLDSIKVAQEAVGEAMKESDPIKAKEIMQRAIQRNTGDLVAKRRDLKSYVASQRRGLKGSDPRKDNPQLQTQTAMCVFDTLQATNSLAFVAANVNDAAKTCHGVKLDNMFKKANLKGRICAVNVATAFQELANLAAMLSLAANDCAATLVPNVDAQCAAAVSGLVYGVGTLGAGAALMAASCNKKFLGTGLIDGEIPSSVGSNEVFGNPDDRRLHQDATAAAPARQLLFGGGKGSIGTQCGIEISGMMWALAKAALYINQADHGTIGPAGKCPPKNIFGGHRVKGKMYELNEAFCTVNVAGILIGYSQVIAYLQLAIVDCSDALNLDAICGAGVTALAGGMAAISQSGAGVHLTCDVFQDPLLKKALSAAGKIDNLSGNKITQILGGGKVLGRRLGEGSTVAPGQPVRLEDVLDMTEKQMEQHYGSPEAVFKMFGHDLNDKALREQQPRKPEMQDVARLFAEPEQEAVGGEALCVA